MLRQVKRSIIDRLGVGRVAGVADEADGRAREAIARAQAIEDRFGQLERIVLFTELVAAARVSDTSVVSIVMPTRNRRELMLHAIESVRAQSHLRWELIVVDDGSTDGSADAAEHLGDERIRVLRASGDRGAGGAAAARNIGLGGVRGEWVTFLDDDNTMAPHWLKAIVRFGSEHDGVRVVYGAQIREHEPDDASPIREPHFWYVDPFDRPRLTTANFIDLGALAVRAGTAELWFDEVLQRFIDWEMIVRLAATETVQALPVWTGAYFTDEASRITHRGELDAWKDFATRLADPTDPMGLPGRRPPASS